MFRPILTMIAALFLAASPVSCQESLEKSLVVDGHISADGQRVTLSWFGTSLMQAGSVMVQRRHLGDVGGESWRTIVPGIGAVMQYTDETTQSGVAYEYQILRWGRDIIDVGYWTTGVRVPAQDQRGHAYVVVDETLAPDLGPYLERFAQDLSGDGRWPS